MHPFWQDIVATAKEIEGPLNHAYMIDQSATKDSFQRPRMDHFISIFFYLFGELCSRKLVFPFSFMRVKE